MILIYRVTFTLSQTSLKLSKACSPEALESYYEELVPLLSVMDLTQACFSCIMKVSRKYGVRDRQLLYQIISLIYPYLPGRMELSKALPPTVIHMSSGAAAGTLATLATHPFDVLKVRPSLRVYAQVQSLRA
jgi:hypothetical protein